MSLQLAIRALCIVALIASGVMVAAWLGKWPSLLKLSEDTALIQPTAALAGFAFALSLLLHTFKLRVPSLILAAVPLLLGGLTLAAGAMGSSLFLDNLLGAPFISDEFTQPGRMAAYTATAFVCLSLGVMLLALKPGNVSVTLAAGFGSVAVGVGGMSSLSYVMGSLGDFGWGAYNGVSPQAALLLFVLAAALLAQCWLVAPRSEAGAPRGFALPVGLAVLVSAVMAFTSFERHEQLRAGEFARLRAIEGTEAVNRRIDVTEDTILRIAMLMAEQNEVEQHEWESTVRMTQTDLPGLILCDIDSRGQRSKSPRADAPDELSAAAWRTAFAETSALQQPVMGSIFVADAAYLFVAASAYGSRGHDVRIVAVFEPEAFMLAALPAGMQQEFTCELIVAGTLVFKGSVSQSTAAPIVSQLRADGDWRLSMTPSDAYLASRRSAAPVTVLTAGILMTILLTAATHLALVSRARAEHLRAAQARTLESRERVEMLVASLPDAVLTVRNDGFIEDVNAAAIPLFALNRDELVGRNIEELLGLDDGGNALRNTKRLEGMSALRGKVIDAEVFRADGQPFLASIRVASFNTVDGRKYLWTVSDISWRHKAERENQRLLSALRATNEELVQSAEEARENAERFAALLASAPEATILVDESGTMLEFSRQAEKLLGYTREEAVGRPVEILLPLNMRERHVGLRAEYLKAPDSRRMARGRDLLALAKSGIEVPVEVNLSPLRYKGQLLVAASLIDLRERLKAAEELSQSERRLRTLNKELESIVYVASHDMRSPLVNLQGFSRQLTSAIQKLEAAVGELPEAKRAELEPIMREEIPEAIGFIASSTRKMDTLIKGLLHMSRLGRIQLHFTAIDMNRLMEEAVRATQFVVNERGIDVKVSDLPPCRGDEGQIGQVFSNLLDNAIKYLDPSRQGEIRIHGHREDGYSVYVVEDNGVGIAEDHQTQVFEIFHRLNPGGAVAGEGLGLSVVRRIVDRHDGDVRVESEPGKGSRFIVTLPTTARVAAATEVQRV